MAQLTNTGYNFKDGHPSQEIKTPESPEQVITIKHLHKSFTGRTEVKAVDDLQFHVNKTECFGLLGPNGAGKTTTLRIITGKSNPDRSTGDHTLLDIFGYDPQRDSLAIKAFSGIVPQQDNLDTELNVIDNLLIYSKFYGIPKKEAKERIEQLLTFMELQDKAKSRIRELSGGMQRRLTIARALINNPKLLILDEPTTGLDPQVRHLIWNKLRELKESGVTILLTTHYMEEAFQICNRIIIMDRGKKMVEGNPKDLVSENLEKFVMEVYGASKDQDSSQICKNYFSKNDIRCEFYNDTLFSYSNNYDTLARFGETFKDYEYYIRHSNLEDVFLKVTGRSLNELQ